MISIAVRALIATEGSARFRAMLTHAVIRATVHSIVGIIVVRSYCVVSLRFVSLLVVASCLASYRLCFVVALRLISCRLLSSSLVSFMPCRLVARA